MISGSNGEPSSPPSPQPPPAFAAGQNLIAPGVTLIANTDQALRIQINVPNYTTTADPVSPYSDISIPGYSVATNPGEPALPNRVIMLQVPAAESATYSIVSQVQASPTPLDVAPARLWSPLNGVLTPSWDLDSTFYSTDQTLPASPISLGSVIQNGGVYYLPLMVQPISFDPVRQNIVFTSQIVADIFLGGAASWAPPAVASSGPWGTEGGLEIVVHQAGLYQLTYDALASAGVTEILGGAPVNTFHLYSQNTEIPIQINSGGSLFSPGDSILFYAPYFNSIDNNTNTLLLLSIPATNGLRMASLDSNPSMLTTSPQPSYPEIMTVKTPEYGFFNEALGEWTDHIFWTRIYAPPVESRG